MSIAIHPDDTVTVDGLEGEWVMEAAIPATSYRPAHVAIGRVIHSGRTIRTEGKEVEPDRVRFVRRRNAELDAANEQLARAGYDEIPRGSAAGQYRDYVLVDGVPRKASEYVWSILGGRGQQ